MKKYLTTTYSLFICTVLVMIIGLFRGESFIKQFYELKDAEIKLSSVVKQLKSSNNLLKSEIMKIKHSKEYANKILHDKYHTLKENEKMLFMTE